MRKNCEFYKPRFQNLKMSSIYKGLIRHARVLLVLGNTFAQLGKIEKKNLHHSEKVKFCTTLGKSGKIEFCTKFY